MKFLTQLRQRDARSRNVLRCLGYCIKQIDPILPWVCTLILGTEDVNFRDNFSDFLICN